MLSNRSFYLRVARRRFRPTSSQPFDILREMETLKIIKSVRFLTAFFIIVLLGYVHVVGQKSVVSNPKQPEAVLVVAPAFIPWIFEKTGTGQTVVEVKINNAGLVTSAKCVEGSPDFPWADHSFEHTAMRWRFTSANEKTKERTARIIFVLKIMENDTPEEELTTIFSMPNQIEIRHKIFESPKTSFPLPNGK